MSSRLRVNTVANPTADWTHVEIDRRTALGNAFPISLVEPGTDGDPRDRVIAGMQAIYIHEHTDRHRVVPGALHEPRSEHICP